MVGTDDIVYRSLHNDRRMFNNIEFLSQARNSGFHGARGANVQNQDVILIVVNVLAKLCNHFHVLPCGQPALKQRKLQPLSVSFHRAKYTPPALLAGYIIRYNVNPLCHHNSLDVMLTELVLADTRLASTMNGG